MGLLNSIFGASKTNAKQKEITELINETMLATFEWEQSGESANSPEILIASTSIRNNLRRIVDLYDELIQIHGHGNLKVKNKVLPSPFPSSINIQMAIMGLLDYAEAIVNKNPTFKNEIITPQTMNKISIIIG